MEDEIDGLVHIGQLSEDHVAKVKDMLNIGDEVEARVIEVERRIGLSLKAMNYSAGFVAANTAKRGRLPGMGLAQPIQRFSVAEYYELEETAEYRSEFFDGEIFGMAGGSAKHSLISANLVRELGNRLKGKPCTAYESNLRLLIQASGLRTYPDAAVYCGKLEFDPEDPRGQTALNPSVLFEVLSPSTEAYDRGKKAENYRLVPSLRAYVLISQDRPKVEVFERVGDGFWRLRETGGLEGAIDLPCIDAALNLAELYDRVEFDAEPPAPVEDAAAWKATRDAAP